MKNLSGKLFGISYIKITALLIALLCLVVLSGFTKFIDRETEIFLKRLGGELTPDSNIVIITIDENDIAAIGPWPIKRSYYALLINSLSDFNVKTVGLEIFLSARFVMQTIYDNLLTKEIEKAGNVVLSSTAGSIYLKSGRYYTDSLSYPSPKLLDDKIKTGHLNLIDDEALKIPLVIKTEVDTEKAFSLQISGEDISVTNIEVNVMSSWMKFKNYSLLEYFDLLQKNKDSLIFLEDKIVLIGTNDSQLSTFVASAFDDKVPGVAFHAFAVDNIINNRWLNNNYQVPSLVVFFLSLCLAAFFIEGKTVKRLSVVYTLVFVLFVIISLIFITVFQVKLSYSYFLLPFIFLVAAEFILYVNTSRKALRGVLAESQILKSILRNKESELARLQKELDVSNEDGSSQLLERVKALKKDIDRFKEKEEDESTFEINIKAESQDFYGIVYRSNVMTEVIDLIKRAAPEDASVLILGESGTGKELVARAIHSLSKRSDKNFVAVNCGAISDSLLESELFGHVKGAFTGAVSDKAGRFETADKGTIFLDEIAETSENFQVKLLRVLQTGDFEKVGSSKTEHVSLRIIAATNKNLEAEVREKKFREDLYYRLNVIKMELPPLRNRKDDIEVLVDYFVKKEANEFRISRSVYKSLKEYQWKGNVRELEAVIKRACIFAKSSKRELIQLSDLPKEIVKNASINFDDLVVESLRSKKFTHSSVSETARELGNVGRTLISENFRGCVLKTVVENNYNIDQAVTEISGSDETDTKIRVRAKVENIMRNIENDVKSIDSKDFEFVKTKLKSKYKNLPQRFHFYLDEIIENHLKM
jgi:transcriptional regulator with GAF, ATPase, and Fis domain/CHASE2 domain-containing sensor protein